MEQKKYPFYCAACKRYLGPAKGKKADGFCPKCATETSAVFGAKVEKIAQKREERHSHKSAAKKALKQSQKSLVINET